MRLFTVITHIAAVLRAMYRLHAVSSLLQSVMSVGGCDNNNSGLHVLSMFIFEHSFGQNPIL